MFSSIDMSDPHPLADVAPRTRFQIFRQCCSALCRCVLGVDTQSESDSSSVESEFNNSDSTTETRISPEWGAESSDSEFYQDMPELESEWDGAECFLWKDEFILDKLHETELVQPEDVLEELAGIHDSPP